MNGIDEKKYMEMLEKGTPHLQHSVLDETFQRMKYNQLRKKLLLQTFVTAVILCVALLGSIRYSTTVASAVSKLPGLKPLVEKIAYDKGMNDVIVNDYYEVLNVSQTINGNTLTLTGVVADESGMSIFYKYKSSQDLNRVQMRIKATLYQNGEEVTPVLGSWQGQEKGTFEAEDVIEVFLDEKIDYSNPNFELEMEMVLDSDEVYTLPFTLKKSIKPSKYFTLNKVLEVDGQRFTVKEVIISPLRTELKLSIDPTNTMKITNFDSIYFYDENGEEWSTIQNGFGYKGELSEPEFSLMFESNYFREPKSLTIVFNKIEAIPKEEDYIVVDWTQNKVLQQPDYLNINILDLKDTYELVYEKNQYKNSWVSVFGEMTDANNNVFVPNSMWFSEREEGSEFGQIYAVNEPVVDPVRVEITRYESYLAGEASVNFSLK
jgi:hypothetical protein